MASKLDATEERPRPEAILQDSIRAPSNSGEAQGNKEKYGFEDQLQHTSSTSVSAMQHMGDNKEIIVTKIRTKDSVGLGRVPGSSEGSREGQATNLVPHPTSGRKVGPIHADNQSSMERDSASCLTNTDPLILGVWLLHRFKRFGDLADLQQGIAILEDLVKFTPVSDDQYREVLSHLGVALSYRFRHVGEFRDIGDAISRQREVIDLTPHSDPDKPAYLTNLGSLFLIRFESLGELGDLEEAISMQRNAIDLTSHGHSSMYHRLNNLGNCFFLRFRRLGDLGDLKSAISSYRDAVDLTPRGEPERPGRLSNLGNSLLTHFRHSGELSGLEDAITRHKDAVDLTPPGHPDKPGRLSNLANSFEARFQRLGELNDLDAAIARYRVAVDLTPHNHSNKSIYLNNLGKALMFRFERFGELSDIEDAISTLRDAVDLTPHNHPHKATCLNALSSSFKVRFDRLGELGDIEDAISRQREAVDLTPHGHPEKHTRLNNLGNCFKARFRRFEKLSDLEEAISRHSDAVDLISRGHPDEPGCLNNLGNSLRARFECFGEPSDLEDAISMLTDAVDLIPHDHPDKPDLLSNLGFSFLRRFQRFGELIDLENAISKFKDAVGLAPHGHPNEPAYLYNLGNSIVARFERLGELRDLKHAISLYSQAASASIGSISVRFDASQKWILCARCIRHHSLLHAYSIALGLLPELAWIGLCLTQRYSQLTQGANIVREAAAAALDLGFPETAVEWLEQGRSIVWRDLLQLRSSYDELSSVHPNHAHRLRELSIALESASTTREKSLSALFEQSQSGSNRTTESLQQEADRHRMLAIERDKLLQEIRILPGFERFLLHKEFSQIRSSAHSGPVVILNAAESRCDALIVLANVDHVIHVPLPNFTSKRSADLQSILKNFVRHARVVPIDEREGRSVPSDGASWETVLSPLWKCVVKPVLDALAFSTPGDVSRIFWCPTGPFVFLPIHAAGFYDSEYSQPGNKVFDFVVSSYVPTLSILALSRYPNTTPSNDICILAVRQPPSDGLSQLPGVIVELQYIKAVIKNSPSAQTTLLESSLGTVEEVLALMKGVDWVHFACHGIQDDVNSGLCLADGHRLKVRDIIRLSRPHGGLAFLSACQTAMGDGRLSDEAIHIAAGMLFAGYGGVVGTMWSISDRLAPEVARDVYGQLFRNGMRPDYREAAQALHEAIGRLRDSGNVPFDEWLPFIHVGL